METTFHGASYFYLVPVAIFLPLVLFGLWSFGLKDLFRRTDAEKRERRLDQIRRDKDAKRRLAKSGGLAVRPVTEPPRSVGSWIGRAIAYGAFAVVLGAFSNWPPYAYWPESTGQLKVSLSVPGDHKEACRKRTRDELAKLPPNMRAPMSCSRERFPVVLEASLDGSPLYRESREPTGLSKDGASAFYKKFPILAGTHEVAVRLSLDGGTTFPYILDHTLAIASGQAVVLGFGGVEKSLFLR